LKSVVVLLQFIHQGIFSLSQPVWKSWLAGAHSQRVRATLLYIQLRTVSHRHRSTAWYIPSQSCTLANISLGPHIAVWTLLYYTPHSMGALLPFAPHPEKGLGGWPASPECGPCRESTCVLRRKGGARRV